MKILLALFVNIIFQGFECSIYETALNVSNLKVQFVHSRDLILFILSEEEIEESVFMKACNNYVFRAYCRL